MITLIAVIDIGSGIGDKDGNLLFNIPKDMAHFKKYTKGKKVIMGRKTWDSLPKKPLKNRENYVVTRDDNFKDNGANVLKSIDEVISMSKEDEEIIIIGGGEIYKQLIDHADKMVLTQVHAININARTFFPDFDHKDWKVDLSESERFEESDRIPSFAITTYNRKK